jgi:hypothetical protein
VLAAAVIDLDSGLLLGVSHKNEFFTQSFLDSLSASAAELFRGTTVNYVEKLISNIRGNQPERLIEQLHYSTEHTHHFMAVLPDKPDILSLLVTDKSVNLGLGWSFLQSKLSDISISCP